MVVAPFVRSNMAGVANDSGAAWATASAESPRPRMTVLASWRTQLSRSEASIWVRAAVHSVAIASSATSSRATNHTSEPGASVMKPWR